MKLRLLFFALLSLFLLHTSTLKADTYPEVIFDNSLVSGVYARSNVDYSGNSWVENLNKHLLVSDTLFFTPGNALSLQYKSGNHGQWQVDLHYSRQKINYQVDLSDFLLLKVYVKTEHTEKKDLPKIAIRQRGSQTNTLNLASFMESFEYNMWVNVKIPIASFKNLDLREPISAISLYQNATSDATHQIFIDQVEFLPRNSSNVKLSSPAVLSSITAYDKQVYLQWQLPLTPSIRYIKIYRSENNKDFSPVAIRPITMQSCLDFVPTLDKTYYYKIAWVDYNYMESPFSEVKEVKTQRLSEEQLLDLVQSAHVNYFVENHDINSGMYLPSHRKDKAVVSVQESGNAVLSLIVGVERGRLSRQVALSRISKMVYFLMKAQNRYGFFPPYFDGRTGLPEYPHGDPSYDVVATTSMVEALLIARQYFANEDELESDLRNRITKLWENIQWNKVVADDLEDVLIDKISGVDSTAKHTTLGGINESMNAYMLAMASPKHAIPLSAYEQGIKKIDEGFEPVYHSIDSLVQDSVRSLINPLIWDSLTLMSKDSVTMNRVRTSILKDTTLYGENLVFEYKNNSLLDLYRPFFTIDPLLLADPEINFKEALQNYIKVRKRRDNEVGVGSTNSDIWGFYQFRDSIGNFRINPAIGPSAIFVLPEVGKKAILALYENYGDNFFTEYGFRAWLDLRNNDVSEEYFARNQAAIIISIENARSGLLWRLYAEIPEIKKVLHELFPEAEKSE